MTRSDHTILENEIICQTIKTPSIVTQKVQAGVNQQMDQQMSYQILGDYAMHMTRQKHLTLIAILPNRIKAVVVDGY